jgi:hypothetical protein
MRTEEEAKPAVSVKIAPLKDVAGTNRLAKNGQQINGISMRRTQVVKPPTAVNPTVATSVATPSPTAAAQTFKVVMPTNKRIDVGVLA